MSHLLAGVLLAVIGSVVLNASYLIQHVGSIQAVAIDVLHPLRTLHSLMRSRLWLAGGALGLIGWALSIAALTQAPLSLVQAFLIGGIAVLAPFAVRLLEHRLTIREVAGIGLVLVALVALTAGRGHVGIHSRFHSGALATYLTISVAAGASLLLRSEEHTSELQ